MFGGADTAVARGGEDVRRAQQRAVKLPVLWEAVDAAIVVRHLASVHAAGGTR